MKKLFATDFDGTFRIDGKISDENREAVKKWREAGNIFGFVTGRGADFSEFLNGLDFYDYDFLLVDTGSKLIVNGKEIMSKEIDRKTFHELENYVRKFDNVVYCCETEKMNSFCQFSAQFDSAETAVKVADEVNEIFKGKASAFVNYWHLNVVAYECGKVSGVRNALEHFGVSEDNVIVTGDDFNDIEMIKTFNGWAVENAREEVKEIAPHICKSVGQLMIDLM